MISKPTDVRDPEYALRYMLWSRQQGQAQENQHVRDLYEGYSKNWVEAQTQNAQNGRPVEPPQVLPVMTVYEDDGTVSHPPFPGLTLPALDPRSIAPAPLHAGFGDPGPSQPSTETQATWLMLQLILQRLDTIAKKLGV
jgi:hypothetical protein